MSKNLFYLIVLIISTLSLCVSFHIQRNKRAAFDLPAGAMELVGRNIDTSFKCTSGDGYFADQMNDCKIFHRCLTQNKAGGQSELSHHSFVCPESTQFDQSALTCKTEDDAIPCSASEMFYDLNERIGQDVPFLTSADIDRAKVARPDFK